MKDYFLEKFYNDIKDESWPEIKNYRDFLSLPDQIKNECYTNHNFSKRLGEIENKEHWRINHGVDAVKFKNNIFVGISKCASTYYLNFFKNLGWDEINTRTISNWNDANVFGFVRHPMERYVTGLAQDLLSICNTFVDIKDYENEDCYLEVFNKIKSQNLTNFIKSVVITKHVIPYSFIFGKHLYDIDWIPMEYDINQQKTYVEKLLENQKISISVSRNDNGYRVADENKKKIYNIIQKILNDEITEGGMTRIYHYYADDLKFYNRLIEKFNSAGKSWNEISWLKQ